MTMRTTDDRTGARRLLVMLPGADMSAEDFRTHGFFAAVRERGLPVDMTAVETGMEAYLDGLSVPPLHEQVIAPAHAAGMRIWLVGISLGGMGALLYARAHPELIAGVVLLAPFIGSRGLIAEVERAGGLRHWRPASGETETNERRLLAWLGAGEGLPDMRLGYGTDDRFAAAHRLLAALLPADRVATAPGGHDWPTWRCLWQEMLPTAAFAAPDDAEQ
ncbi:MAG TPA: alpha/beta fold hydrolase [Aliidongia sp.]|nr:alpha/beta fold hydrolase [Aliidongia sp.]